VSDAQLPMESVDEQGEAPKAIVDYAKTGRSKCYHCRKPIPKGEMRVRLPALYKSRLTGHWYHRKCLSGLVFVGMEIDASAVNDNDRGTIENAVSELPAVLSPTDLSLEGVIPFVGRLRGIAQNRPHTRSFVKEFGEKGLLSRVEISDGTSIQIVAWDNDIDKLSKIEPGKGYEFSNLSLVEGRAGTLELHATKWTETNEVPMPDIPSPGSSDLLIASAGLISRATKPLICAGCRRRMERGTFRVLWDSLSTGKPRPHHLGCADPKYVLETVEAVFRSNELSINDLEDLRRRTEKVLAVRAPEFLQRLEKLP
jgi:hypothetical protein